MKTYIIDDSSIKKSWMDKLDRGARYVILYTADELQHMTNEDQRILMAHGIKSEFIRCLTLEDLYLQIGYQVGRASVVGEDIILVSDSEEYDKNICSWRRQGICVNRELSG